ncbi:MAG: PQQ-binding-like beta-propeller repeat protein [Armatimonadetes bacterium]|nr:PQQ-binding-like beta-propeller repeat protein [Armatimonadota bacterium]
MLTFLPLFLPPPSAPTFEIKRQFSVTGDGGWDYLTVDPDSKRLFITRGTHVQVMDTESGKLITDIPDTPGVHGVALDKAANKGFISNGRDDSVSIIDLKTLKETSRVKVGQGPDAILFDSSSNTVFSFNGRSHNASAIDAKSGKVRGEVALEGKPEDGISDGKGDVYVNLEDKSEVVEFDAKSLKVLKRWSLAPGEEPTGIAYDAKKGLVFSACGNAMLAVSDAKTGKVLQTTPTGDGTDYAGYDPSSGTVFTSNGEGTLSVVQASSGKYSTVQNLKTKTSARTMAVDAKHHLIYLIAADFEAPQPGRRRGAMKPNSAIILVVGVK